MRFDFYSKHAFSTSFAGESGDRYEQRNNYDPALGLIGELGEVAEHVKKTLRDNQGQLTIERRVSIIKELGDVLWYINAVVVEGKRDLANIAGTEDIESFYEVCSPFDGDTFDPQAAILKMASAAGRVAEFTDHPDTSVGVPRISLHRLLTGVYHLARRVANGTIRGSGSDR